MIKKCMNCGSEIPEEECNKLNGICYNCYNAGITPELVYKYMEAVVENRHYKDKQIADLQAKNEVMKETLNLAIGLLETNAECPTIEHVAKDCDNIECRQCWVDYLTAKAKESE